MIRHIGTWDICLFQYFTILSCTGFITLITLIYLLINKLITTGEIQSALHTND